MTGVLCCRQESESLLRYETTNQKSPPTFYPLFTPIKQLTTIVLYLNSKCSVQLKLAGKLQEEL